MKPLLTLCMMVKDEAHTIARTLRSAVPFVDRIVIVDTGSTDGTKEIVWQEFGDDAAGAVFDEPFVDFAITRNVLLQRATESWGDDHPTEFLLLLDADDVLEGGEALRAFLEVERGRLFEDITDKIVDPVCCVRCGHWRKHHGNKGYGGDSDACYERTDGPDGAPDEGPACDCPAFVRPIPPEREAFYLQMSQGPTRWDSARVVRADAGWRYVGAVHEVLCHPDRPAPSIRIPGVTIRHDPPPVSAERSRARWERDLVLLRAEVERDPKSARAAFYLAKTLRQLGRTEDAITAFDHRLALGGFWQERYDAAFERARLLPDPVVGMLEAHAIDPRRAEPLAALAIHYAARKLWGPAYLFARRAWELPEPEGALFVDSGVYTWWAADLVSWSASHVGEWETGERAARQALEHGPEHHRDRLAANLAFYEARKAAT